MVITQRKVNSPKEEPKTKLPQAISDASNFRKNACEARGGRWDEATQTCIMPEKTPEVVEDKPKTDIGAFRDVETGELSGFSVGDKDFLGVSPKDVRETLTKEAESRELPLGGQAEAVLEKQRQQLQKQGAGLVASVGATPSDEILRQLESQITAGQASYVGALASAVPGIIPDLLTGAATGAGIALVAGQAGPQVAVPEEIVTVPVAAAIVGVVNVIKGFYSDFVRDVARQKSELIETPIRTLSETKPRISEIINAQNANPENAVANRDSFNNQIAFIDLAYEDLKDLTDDQLNKFLGDTGINQIQEYEVFYALDGERDGFIRDMQLALANPDPARIRPTAITIDDIKKRIEKELK